MSSNFIWAMGGYMGFLIFGSLIILAAWVMMALWVHRDAENKCIENSGLWAVLTGVAGIIGLVIYLAVNSAQRKAPKYPLVDGIPQPPAQKSNKLFMTLFIVFVAVGTLMIIAAVVVLLYGILSSVPYYY